MTGNSEVNVMMSKTPDGFSQNSDNKEPLIKVTDLRKKFGKFEALRGLTFSVYNEIYALLGRNGAGKSTTLKILVGLLRASGGRAEIMGVDVSNRVETLKNVGYVPEDPLLFPNLTAEEVLRYSASLRGLKGYEEWMYYLLESFSLKGSKVVGGMSKGMIQKLCVCVAFLHRPKVLIMDEPTANMDPESQHIFRELVRETVKEGGCALISTHQLEAVEKFCNRAGIISSGRIVLETEVREGLEDVYLSALRKAEE